MVWGSLHQSSTNALRSPLGSTLVTVSLYQQLGRRWSGGLSTRLVLMFVLFLCGFSGCGRLEQEGDF